MGGLRCYRRTYRGPSTYCWQSSITGVFRTWLTLRSGFSARCRSGYQRLRGSSRMRCPSTPIMPGRICILGRPHCISVSRRPASRRLNRRSDFAPDDPNLAITYWVLGTCQLLLGRVDQAIDLLQTARAAKSRWWVPYFYLAGAYGLKGDLDRARSALGESLRLKPALRSVARMRAENPWLSNPQYWA